MRSLNQRIRNLAGEESPEDKQRLELRLRRAIANVVVSHMLPDGVVKGGTAMKLRIGEAGSRFTPDFDAARSRPVDLDDYLDALDDRLAAGWGGFTVDLVTVGPHPVGQGRTSADRIYGRIVPRGVHVRRSGRMSIDPRTFRAVRHI